MRSLCFPSFDYRVKEVKGEKYIFDISRKKYVCLTNEEWVRQHVLHHLVKGLSYPLSLIRLECGLQYGSLIKRADIVVSDRMEGNPIMLVECKAAEERIQPKHLLQIASYNKFLDAPFLLITNGLTYLCFRRSKSDTIRLDYIPTFTDLHKATGLNF
jgi:hypothetical protein